MADTKESSAKEKESSDTEESREEHFDTFDSRYSTFYKLKLEGEESEQIRLIGDFVKGYNLNKKSYSNEPKKLSVSQLTTIINLRNRGVPATAICHTLKIQTRVLTKMIKNFGYQWNISTKSYVLQTSSKKKKKPALIERTQFHNLKVDPTTYRILALRSYLDNLSIGQIICNYVLEHTNSEIKKLADKPSNEIKYHRLNQHKK